MANEEVIAAPPRNGRWTSVLMSAGIVFLAGYIVVAFMPGVMTLGDYAKLRTSDYVPVTLFKAPLLLLCIVCIGLAYRQATEKDRRHFDILLGLSYFAAAVDWFCLDVRLMQVIRPLLELNARVENPAFVELRIRLLTFTPSTLTFLLLGTAACFLFRVWWAWAPLLAFLVLTGHIMLLSVPPQEQPFMPVHAAQSARTNTGGGAATAEGEGEAAAADTAQAAPEPPPESVSEMRVATAAGGTLTSFWELLFHDAALGYAFLRWRAKRPRCRTVVVKSAQENTEEESAAEPEPVKKEAEAPLNPEAAKKAAARAEKIAAAKKARAARKKKPPAEDETAAKETKQPEPPKKEEGAEPPKTESKPEEAETGSANETQEAAPNEPAKETAPEPRAEDQKTAPREDTGPTGEAPEKSE